MLSPGSVHELRVWFPDPWHKKRHHKRRLVTPEFARLAARVLEPGGVWRLATDWEDYAEQIRSVITESPDFDGGEWGPRSRGARRRGSRARASGWAGRSATSRPCEDPHRMRA